MYLNKLINRPQYTPYQPCTLPCTTSSPYTRDSLALPQLIDDKTPQNHRITTYTPHAHLQYIPLSPPFWPCNINRQKPAYSTLHENPAWIHPPLFSPTTHLLTYSTQNQATPTHCHKTTPPSYQHMSNHARPLPPRPPPHAILIRTPHWRIASFNVARSYNPNDLVVTIQTLKLNYLAIQEPPPTFKSPISLPMYDRNLPPTFATFTTQHTQIFLRPTITSSLLHTHSTLEGHCHFSTFATPTDPPSLVSIYDF